jgi:hypothetical protein
MILHSRRMLAVWASLRKLPNRKGLQVLRVLTMRSNIKGKASHKIVSDGKQIQDAIAIYRH